MSIPCIIIAHESMHEWIMKNLSALQFSINKLLLIFLIVCLILNFKHSNLRYVFNSTNAVATLHNISIGLENKTLPVDSEKTVRNCLTGDTVFTYKALFEKENLSLNSVYGSFTESSKKRTKSFVEVYKMKAWGNIKEYSHVVKSGPGSTLYFAQEAIGMLHNVVTSIKQSTGKTQISMLDIPCGDMTWMSRFLKTRDDINYTGIDIVSGIISRHQHKFKNQSNWTFLNADVLDDNTTIGKYDLIFSRMMMQHLYHYDVMKVLMKISKSGSKYVLMTSFSNAINTQLGGSFGGRYRPLNLQVEPFRLTPPVCIHRDGPPEDQITKEVFLGLWTLPLHSVKNCVIFKAMAFRNKHNKRVYFGCGG